MPPKPGIPKPVNSLYVVRARFADDTKAGKYLIKAVTPCDAAHAARDIYNEETDEDDDPKPVTFLVKRLREPESGRGMVAEMEEPAIRFAVTAGRGLVELAGYGYPA